LVAARAAKERRLGKANRLTTDRARRRHDAIFAQYGVIRVQDYDKLPAGGIGAVSYLAVH
jgi:hypothetical protein